MADDGNVSKQGGCDIGVIGRSPSKGDVAGVLGSRITVMVAPVRLVGRVWPLVRLAAGTVMMW
jgi:hypothetical protein